MSEPGVLADATTAELGRGRYEFRTRGDGSAIVGEPVRGAPSRTAGGAHPLCALYRVEAVLPIARRNFAANQLALRDVLAAVTTAWLEPEAIAVVDRDGLALSNVNTPEDLAEFERRIAAG